MIPFYWAFVSNSLLNQQNIFYIYEQRLREGYPRRTISPNKREQRLLANEQKYIRELECTCTAGEVESCIKKFTPIMSSAWSPSKVTIIRVLAVFVLMQHWTKQLLLADCASYQPERLHLISLVGNCRQGIQKSCNYWNLYHGSTKDLIQEANKSSIFKYICERVYGSRHVLEESHDENSFMGLVLDGRMVI